MFRLTTFCLLFLAAAWALPSPKRHSMRLPARAIAPRIVNGAPATLGQFPWQAAMFIDDEQSTWFCGGSLISADWIVTAGHCVDGAVSGIIFTGSVSPLDGDIALPIQFILHEEYLYDGQNLENDIGLIRLLFSVTLNANTAAIRLSNDILEAGVDVTATGYGLIGDNATNISDNLNYVELTIISNEDCQAYYSEAINAGMVCATSFPDFDRGTCSGDSGGGLVRNADTDPEHVAVVSFVADSGCESKIPDGFTRTATHRDWIRGHSGI